MEDNMKEKIKFGDLDNWLKFGIVLAYIVGILYGILFLIGFITAIISGG